MDGQAAGLELFLRWHASSDDAVEIEPDKRWRHSRANPLQSADRVLFASRRTWKENCRRRRRWWRHGVTTGRLDWGRGLHWGCCGGKNDVIIPVLLLEMCRSARFFVDADWRGSLVKICGLTRTQKFKDPHISGDCTAAAEAAMARRMTSWPT